jgi:RimJ/RimL family protein N-acetyltransferase
MLTSRVPPITVSLRDGTPVRVRLVRADDRDRVLRGVREMSQTTRYLRFFAGTREMSEGQARHLTEIDQVNHVAVCAVEPTDSEERGYGIARFVRDARDPRLAEFAVVVIDPMQGRGLGTVLLAALVLRAQAAGVEEFYGHVLTENPVMPRWMERLGATLSLPSDGGYWMVRWPVSPLPSPGGAHLPEDLIRWLDRLRPTFGAVDPR